MQFNILKKKYDEPTKKILACLFGVCVGDALGVSSEFKSRQSLSLHPVTDMVGNGTHKQPLGTWSDDSSLTFCLAESLCIGFDTSDIAEKFIAWACKNYWTPHGKVFDIGNATSVAILNLQRGVEPEKAGGTTVYTNGNGSLMRCLPIAFYLQAYQGDKFEIVEKVSSITHGHIISKIACSIYIEIVLNILKGLSPKESYESMKPIIIDYYTGKGFKDSLKDFEHVLQYDISKFTEDAIKSSGYVVDTLEASIWCLLTTNSYKEAVLKAVNLGDDTDTTGAVTGGLSGIYYGFDSIPKEWLESMAKSGNIKNLGQRLSKSLYRK